MQPLGASAEQPVYLFLRTRVSASAKVCHSAAGGARFEGLFR